jgi:hypothetical protein
MGHLVPLKPGLGAKERERHGTGAAATDSAGQRSGPRYEAIQRWFGHRSITGTAVYTAVAPNRFKDFWRE